VDNRFLRLEPGRDGLRWRWGDNRYLGPASSVVPALGREG
jgi:hypothetical protein